MIRRIALFATSIFLLYSCATIEYKKNYLASKFYSFNKYKLNDEMGYTLSNPRFKLSMEDSALRKLKMRTIKKELTYLEKQIALSPDSTATFFTNDNKSVNRVDSFYINKEKVKFLQSNGLVSKNMYFIQ
jgi:hypothetical protein